MFLDSILMCKPRKVNGYVYPSAAKLIVSLVAFGIAAFGAPEQQNSCTYQISPANPIVAADVDSLTISVSTGPECTWTATTNTTWLSNNYPTVGTVKYGPGASVKGNGTIVFQNVTPNSGGGVIVGSVSVGGQAFNIRRAPQAIRLGIYRGGDWLEDVDGDNQFQYNTPPDRDFQFGGQAGDIPIVGDWNGSGTSKLGFYRAGIFYLDYDGDNLLTSADKMYNLGLGIHSGDVPVAGDFNGDGKYVVGLYRDGTWYIDTNGNGVFEPGIDQTYQLGGIDGDEPVVGDWNAIGKSCIGLRRAGYFWILDGNCNGVLDDINVDGGDMVFAYGGIPGDVPVVGNWSNDGRTRVGVYRANFLWVTNTYGDGQNPTYQAVAFGGLPGDIPIVGRWTKSADGR